MNPSSSTLHSSSAKRKRDPNDFDDEPISCKRLKNDVFLNYSFEDIGNTFISHLRREINRNSFIISDHTMLPVGQDMCSELLKAIDESEMYVLVFSPNYASSARCLDELGDVMNNVSKFKRKALPVFFKVDPSDVRSQQGSFLEAFQAHETNVDPKRVEKWRKSLKDAGQLSGLALQIGRDEGKFILEIIEQLAKMQRPQELHVTDHPVGIGSRAEDLISTLKLDWKDRVLVVAVFGFSGIGKTTIVKEAFNRIAPSFDVSCFLPDIHYICKVPNWKVELPNALISRLTHENKFLVTSNHNDGVTMIRRLLSRQKVLLVLDDVDSFQHLEALGICPKWFYEGSRIIVTTRDKRALGNIPYAPYHTMLLNKMESLNLFTRLMFVRDNPVNIKFIEEIVDRAGGLPLVLKVWSRHFQQHDREQWPSILETLKRIPHGDVQEQLRLSYDSLSPRLQKLFLDIACFFDGMQKDIVVKVLQDEDSGFFPNIEIQYLVDKNLVQIEYGRLLQMHHAIREMGQEIVRQENEDEPGQRTRLSDKKDVERVLTERSGTGSVESIRVESYDSILGPSLDALSLDAFRKMSNLKFIHSSVAPNMCKFSHNEMTHLCFRKLKYMSWDYFPLKSLDNIEMCNVVVLKLQKSNLETLWEGIKSLKKLRILDVGNSLSLTKTGNFYGLENLEKLSFEGCRNLEELDNSIGDLQKLAILDLNNSIQPDSIPWEMIGKLASLRELIVGYEIECDEIDTDYEIKYDKYDTDPDPDPLLEVDERFFYYLKECPLTDLTLCNCNVSKVLGDVSLATLKYLRFGWIRFWSHPDSLLQLQELNSIRFDDCNTIRSIPCLPLNITQFHAWGCSSLVNLPHNITELKSLTWLTLHNCPKLGTEDPLFLMKITGLTNLSSLDILGCSVSHVPSEIGNLVSLQRLDLRDNSFSSLPDSLSNLSQLLNLHLQDCNQLRLLPLLPSNLEYITADGCDALDVMSSASVRTRVCKETPFTNRLTIHNLPWKEEVPKWCSYKSRENNNVISFVAPHNNICAIIFCANTTSEKYHNNIIPKMYNKTKNTSHDFEERIDTLHNSMCVVSYPLDGTTLMVEPGDTMEVVFELHYGRLSSCGLRLIYESDVVDNKLVLQTAADHTNDSHGQDYSSSAPLMKMIPTVAEATPGILWEMLTVPKPHPLGDSPTELSLFR